MTLCCIVTSQQRGEIVFHVFIFFIIAINFVSRIMYVVRFSRCLQLWRSVMAAVSLPNWNKEELDSSGTIWISREGGFNFSWCCYMMLIDSAIYFLLGWYLRTAFPGLNFLMLITDSVWS